MNHHINGPSALDRRNSCPLSMSMEIGLPELPSDYAEEGQLLHEAVSNDELLTNLDSEQLRCIETVHELMDQFPDAVWTYEDEFSVYYQGELLTFGTCDAWASLGNGRYVIIDFKFGRKEVETPANNIQLGSYSAGLAQRFPQAESVEAYICQPRLRSHNHPHFIFTDFPAIVETIDSVIHGCHARNAECHSGPHCQYCRAQFTCETLGNLLESVANWDASGIHEGNAVARYAKLKTVKPLIANIEKRIKAVVTEQNGEVGEPGAGLHYVAKRGRIIPNPQVVYDAYSDMFETAEFMDFCTVKIGALEKAACKYLVAAGAEKTQAAAKRSLASRIEYGIKETLELKLWK